MSETTGEPDLTPALRDLHAMVRVRLARHDHRDTPGRRRLVEALAGAGRPVTLSEIALSDPDLPVSSTYRNLEVLERSGVVNRISIRGDRAYFELAEPLLSHHHHLVCVACGAIEDIHLDDELEDLVDRNLAEAARRAAFTPLRHLLDLHGHCSSCEPPGGYLLDDTWSGKNDSQLSAAHADDTTNRECVIAHEHADACYDHPQHTHADHADHCGMEEHNHADHCDDDHDHGDHCDVAEHSHADHADHCDMEEHIHTEECCNAA